MSKNDANKKSNEEDNTEEDNKQVEEDVSIGKKIGDGIMFTGRVIYKGLQVTVNSTKSVLGYIFYPLKENFTSCIREVDYKVNPYKNPNYHEI